MAVTQLTPGAARVIDPVLTNVSTGYKPANMVGDVLFPTVPVGKRGGHVIGFDKTAFRLYNTVRTPGAMMKTVNVGFSATDFALVDHGLAGLVPIEDIEEAQGVPGVDLQSEAVLQVMQAFALEREVEQAALARDATQYPASNKADISAAKWSTAVDPLDNIKAARAAIRAEIGIYPNVAVIGARAYEALQQNAATIDRMKYTSADSITEDLLARLWQLKKVVVGEAIYADDQGAFTGDVWSADVILAYVPLEGAGQRVPSYGYTYQLKGRPVAYTPSWNTLMQSWLHPVVTARKPVTTAASGGFLIQNAA